MYRRIPTQRTKAINNWCCWQVYERKRVADSQLEKDTIFNKILGITVGTTEPQQLSRQDQIIVLSAMPNNLTGTSIKVWCKDIPFGFDGDNHYLKMTSRTTPDKRNLPLLDGYYKVIQGQDKIGIKKEDWLLLFKVD